MKTFWILWLDRTIIISQTRFLPMMIANAIRNRLTISDTCWHFAITLNNAVARSPNFFPTREQMFASGHIYVHFTWHIDVSSQRFCQTPSTLTDYNIIYYTVLLCYGLKSYIIRLICGLVKLNGVGKRAGLARLVKSLRIKLSFINKLQRISIIRLLLSISLLDYMLT